MKYTTKMKAIHSEYFSGIQDVATGLTLEEDRMIKILRGELINLLSDGTYRNVTPLNMYEFIKKLLFDDIFYNKYGKDCARLLSTDERMEMFNKIIEGENLQFLLYWGFGKTQDDVLDEQCMPKRKLKAEYIDSTIDESYLFTEKKPYKSQIKFDTIAAEEKEKHIWERTFSEYVENKNQKELVSKIQEISTKIFETKNKSANWVIIPPENIQYIADEYNVTIPEAEKLIERFINLPN